MAEPNSIIAHSPLQSAAMDPATVEAEKINGILNGLSTQNDARGIILQNIRYKDRESGEYKSGWNKPQAVTSQSINDVSIEVDGKTRYFHKIASTTDGMKATNATDMKATAWEERDKDGNSVLVNGKKEIQLSFTGYLGDALDAGAMARHLKFDPETHALSEVIDGKLNPQALDAAAFTHRVIQEAGGKDKISHLIFGSHSLGASNALAAHAVSDLEGVPTKTTGTDRTRRSDAGTSQT